VDHLDNLPLIAGPVESCKTGRFEGVGRSSYEQRGGEGKAHADKLIVEGGAGCSSDCGSVSGETPDRFSGFGK
jgi:hypothetical protein